jgi:hypothetical protein
MKYEGRLMPASTYFPDIPFTIYGICLLVRSIPFSPTVNIDNWGHIDNWGQVYELGVKKSF